MNTEHNHLNLTTSREGTLLLALILTSSFLVVELAGSFLTGSLALLSDAAHMLTDVTALVIAFVAIKIGKRPADAIRTFGYYRFEILAAAFNTILLFLVALYILFEAYQRLQHPPEIHSTGMLIIACIGLLVNLVSMRLLTTNKDKGLNLKSAYLEVWSDMLGSLGVIIGSLIIRFTGWIWVDSFIAVLIGLWVLPRTWILLKESINILLEGVPAGVDINKLKEEVYKVKGILDIHELHVWAITNDKISLTAHVVIDQNYDCQIVLTQLRELLSSQYEISHTTLQHEWKKCFDGNNICNFVPTK